MALRTVSVPERMFGSIKDKVLNSIPWPNKTKEKDSSPSLLDLADTLKFVNYRYDFPQGLTEEQKKSLKRFDIFRYNIKIVH